MHRPRTLFALQELFPHHPNDGFVVANSAKLENGTCTVGDAVLFNQNGIACVGEVMTCLQNF